MFKAGDRVRIKGYGGTHDGAEGLLKYDQKRPMTKGVGGEVAFFDVTNTCSSRFPIGTKDLAMYFSCLELVHSPEELICEDWS